MGDGMTPYTRLALIAISVGIIFAALLSVFQVE